MENNKQVVKDFFDAFLYNDKSKLKLADDFVHSSPMGRYKSAEEFLNHCWHLAGAMNEYLNFELISEGNIVCAKYDFPVEEGKPTASVMEWHMLRDGKIKEVNVVYDTGRFKER